MNNALRRLAIIAFLAFPTESLAQRGATNGTIAVAV